MRRRACLRQARECRRGVAAVEFAVIAPLYLALLIGTLEIGKALETSNVLAAALREGGRLAGMDWDGVLPDGVTPNEKVEDDIRNFLKAAGLPGDDVELTITSVQGDDAGQPFDLSDSANRLRLFRIEATIGYEHVSSFPIEFMEGKTLRQSLTFRAGRTNSAYSRLSS